MPVTCCNCSLLFGLSQVHTTLDTMVDTRSVCDNDGRTRIAFSFYESLHTLVVISTLCDLSNVYITIAHCDSCKVFLLNVLTSCCELSDSTGRGSLGGLTTGIGVNFGIEYKDVNILCTCKNVVNATETDVVCPTVTTEDPLGLLAEVILVVEDVLSVSIVTVASFKSSDELLGSRSVQSGGILGCKVVSDSFLHFILLSYFCKSFCGSNQTVAKCSGSEFHTITELCVILEQGVSPCRSLTLFVYGVRSRRGRTAPDRGTTGSICDIHSVTEQLGNKLSVRSLTTTCTCAGELE